MIRITCTHCRQTLTIDDGFAGGVCRCQHCGTIQTVPVPTGKAQGRGASPAAKTLYRAHTRHDGDDHHHGSGSGLDELAEVVSSSGVTNSRRLRQAGSAMGVFPAPLAPPKYNWAMIFGITGAAVVLTVIVTAVVMSRRGGGGNNSTPAPTTSPTPVAVENGPTFWGMKIKAQDTVVYLLDDGSSASDFLPEMQAATFESIKSLGPDRRFKVIFWRGGEPTYPVSGTARATASELALCERMLLDAYGQGNPQVDDGLKAAMQVQPDAIVLVTAKAAQLAEDFNDNAMAIRGDSHVAIYTVGINGDSTSDPITTGILAGLAQKTGGDFLNISSADLHRQSRQ